MRELARFLLYSNSSVWKLFKTQNKSGVPMEPTCPKPGRAMAREKDGNTAVRNSLSPHIEFLKINRE